MKSRFLSFLIIITFFACSKDDNTITFEEGFDVSGKFLAPNGLDAISNARVSAYVDTQLISETRTDPEGNYTINLPTGNFTLVLNKGKFKTEKEISILGDTELENYRIEILPNMAVVTGLYDNIESVLYDIGFVNPLTGEPLFDIIEGQNFMDRLVTDNEYSGRHEHSMVSRNESNPNLEPNVDFDIEDLLSDTNLLGSYDIIFLNCGLSESFIDNAPALEAFVANGGILYATDWAAGYLDAITNSGTNYLTPLVPEKSGISTTTVATILDGDLSAWLLMNFDISVDDTVEIHDFLDSWQVIDSYDQSTTISWLNGPVTYWDDTNMEISENKDLAFTFIHGEGAVFYSSFHTENNQIDDFSEVDRIMQFLVFEMSDQ